MQSVQVICGQALNVNGEIGKIPWARFFAGSPVSPDLAGDTGLVTMGLSNRHQFQIKCQLLSG